MDGVLGSGVWEWREFVPAQQMAELFTWDGEAFPIIHPTFGKMYVFRGPTTGLGRFDAGRIFAAYDGAFLIPHAPEKSSHARSTGGLGEYGFSELTRMMDRKRISISTAYAPAIVQFDNDADRYTGRLLRIWSESGQPEIVLRFFVVPTKKPMSQGILNHLPWLLDAFKSRDNLVPNRPTRISASAFLTDAQLAPIIKELNQPKNSRSEKP